MVRERLGFTDILGAAAQRDIIVVLPTLEHALVLWPKFYEAIVSRHGGEEWVARTRTAIVMRRTKTALRLWVPYSGAPTQPLDTPQNRAKYELVTMYTAYDCRLTKQGEQR